jgi:hypothetical protein
MILMQADIDEDVYASARKLEDREYDEKEAMNEEREEQIEMIQLDYTGPEEIRSPRASVGQSGSSLTGSICQTRYLNVKLDIRMSN